MLIDYSQQQYWLSVMFSDLVIALLIKAIVITGAPHKVHDPWCYSEATIMFFTIKSNVSLTDRGYLNTENKNLQAMKWCDVINLIYFLPAINDSRKLKNKYN